MAQQKKIYLGEAEIGLSELKTQVQQIQRLFSNLNLNESASKGFGKQITTIEARIEKMSQKIKEGFSSTRETESMKNELTSISKLINDFVKDTDTKIKFEDIIGIDEKTEKKIKNLEEELDKLQKKQKELLNSTALRARIGGKSSKDMGFNTGDFTRNLVDNILDSESIDRAFKEKINSLSSQLDNSLDNLNLDLAEKLLGEKWTSKTASSNMSKLTSALGLSGRHTKEELTTVFNQLKNQSQEVEKNNNQIKTYINNLIAWNKEVLGVSSEITEEYNKTGNSIEKVNNIIKETKETQIKKVVSQLKEMGASAETLTKVMTELGVATDKVGKGLQEATERQKFFDNLNDKIKNVFSAASAFYGLQRAIRFSIDTVQELDAAFTEIAVVTDMTTSQLWESFDTYNKMAQELGVTTVEAIETSALYYQQGLETAEVMTLTEETIKMARIAGMDFAEATDRMTAALRGFKLEMEDASRVNDVFSALAAKSAVDTDELSSALTRTASIAESAGMNLETTSAFLSQMIETTREAPENLGTAMKTIVARFQELKKNLDEVEVDGEIVDANKVETALRSVEVALRDEVTGQFRDLDDVFLELSSIWDTLDRNTQRYIATIAAGSRQQSRFIAMMDNYERTVELVDIAQNSSEASAEQFNKTLDSMQSRLNQVKASLEELVGTLVNSDWVKDIISGLNNIIQFFNSLAEAGPVVTVLFTVTLAKLIKNLVTNVAQGFQEVDERTKKLREKIDKTFKKAVKSVIQINYVNEKGQPTNPENERARLEGKLISNNSSNQSASNKEKKNTLKRNLALNNMTMDDLAKLSNENRNLMLNKGILSANGKKTLGKNTGIKGLFSGVKNKIAKNPEISGGIASALSLGIQGWSMTRSDEQALGSTLGGGIGQIVGSAFGPLGGAIGSLAGTIIGTAIGAWDEVLKYGLDNTKAAMEKLQKDANEANQQATKNLEEYQSLKELRDEYEELSNSTNQTIADKERLKEISDELISQYPELSIGLNVEASGLENNIKILDDYIQKKKEASEASAFEANVLNAETELRNTENELTDSITKKSTWNNIFNVLGGGWLSNMIASTELGTLADITDASADTMATVISGYANTSGIINDSLVKDLVNQAKLRLEETGNIEEFQKIIDALKNSAISNREWITEVEKDFSLYLNNLEQIEGQFEQAGLDVFTSKLEDLDEKENEFLISQKSILSEILTSNEDFNKAVKNRDYYEVTKQVEDFIEEYQNVFNDFSEEDKEDWTNALNLMGMFDKADKNKYLEALKNAGYDKAIINAMSELFDDDFYNSVRKNFSTLTSSMKKYITEDLKNVGPDIQGAVAQIAMAFDPTSFKSYNTSIENFAKVLNVSLDSDIVKNFSKILRENLEQTSYSLEDSSKNLQKYGNDLKNLKEMEEASFSGSLTQANVDELKSSYDGLTDDYFEQTINGYKLVGTSIREIIALKNQEYMTEQQLIIAQSERMLLQQAQNTDRTYQQIFDLVANGGVEAFNDLSYEEQQAYYKSVELKNSIDEASNAILKLQGYLETNVNAPFISDLQELDYIVNSLKTAQSVLSDFNENQTLSLANAIDLINANEDYAQAIDVVNGRLTLNSNAVKEITKAKFEEYQNSVLLEKFELQASLEQKKILEEELTNRINMLTETLNAETITADHKQDLMEQEEDAQNRLYNNMLSNDKILAEEESKIDQSSHTTSIEQLKERFGKEAELIAAAQENWLAYWKARDEGEKAIVNKDIIDDYSANIEKIFSPENAPIDWDKYFSPEDGNEMDRAALNAQIQAQIDSLTKSREYIRKEISNLENSIRNKDKILSITDISSLFETGKAEGKSDKEIQKEIEGYIERIDRFRNLLQDIETMEANKDKFSFLAENGKDVNEMSKSVLNLQQELVNLEAKYNEASEVYDTERIRLLGELQSKYGKYVHEQNGQLILDDIEILGLTEEQAEELVDLVDQYDNAAEAVNEYAQKARDAALEQEENLSKQRQAIIVVQEKLAELMIEQDRKQIEAVKKKYDLIKREDEKYLDSVRKNIDKERKLREKDESYENLTEMQNRLNLLKRDTSGVYRLEILELEEQIEEERQNLQDQEVDDLVSNLEEQTNERHAAMDDEVTYLEAVQEEKERTMTEYNARITELMQEGYEVVLEYIKTYDEEYQKGTLEQQQEFEKEWTENAQSAQTAIDAIKNGLNEIETSNAATSLITSYDKIQAKVKLLTEEYKKLEEQKRKAESVTVTNKSGQNKPSGNTNNTSSPPRVEEKEDTSVKVPETITPPKVKKGTKWKRDEGSASLDIWAYKNGYPYLYSDSWMTGRGLGYNLNDLTVVEDENKDGMVKVHTTGQDFLNGPLFDNPPHAYMKVSDLKKLYKQYKTGGIVNYTGPAWVDGTPTKPEAFLSASDTENIAKLRDVLSNVFSPKANTSSDNIVQNSGDIYYEFHINVDGIDSEERIDETIEKIKKEIMNASRGRNVVNIKRGR